MSPSSEPVIEQGACHVLFAYDVGFSVDLDECERRITANAQRETMRHRRRAPRYFEYTPAPLRVVHETGPLRLGDHETRPSVDLVVYDFGAVLVLYGISLSGPVSCLRQLSDTVYDNPLLMSDSRTRLGHLLEVIGPAVARPRISEIYEDYVIFQIQSLAGAEAAAEAFVQEQASLIAQVLRAESKDLSEGEVRDALSLRMSFAPADIVVVDWHAALLIDSDGDDVRAVIEFANAELLEMRFLDEALDAALEQSHQALARREWQRGSLFGRAHLAELGRVAEWQIDSATQFEGVNNALKLIGDQYLARVYRLVSQRFRLAEWDSAIIRKLDTLESVYEKMSDWISVRRLELLEWIIILLIAVSIALPLLGLAY